MKPTYLNSPYSTFLSATPSWKEVGRLLDLGGTFDDYNRSESPDFIAMQMDLRAVGAAMWLALAQLADGIPPKAAA
jgi:hypothetical protein